MSTVNAGARPSLFEIELERAASLCLKPSQYIGWEPGSTAGELLRRKLASGGWGYEPGVSMSQEPAGSRKRVLLIWPGPYSSAMKDALLLEAYDVLARSEAVLPERMVEAGEDLKSALAARGFEPWFSLESKSGFDAFDACVLFEGAVSESLRNALNKFKGILIQAASGASGLSLAEDVLKALGVSSPVRAAESVLLAFSSGGRDGEKPQAASRPMMPHQSFSARVCLRRSGWSRFLSHLEQIQIIKNSARAAGLPVQRTQGKNSKMKISFGPAVSVGWNSDSEYFDMELAAFIEAPQIASKLAAALPLGYSVASVKRIPRHFPSLEESANVAQFTLQARPGASFNWEPLLDFCRASKESRAPSLTVRKEKPGNKVDVILVADILKDAALSSDGNLEITLHFGPKKNLKPEKILEAVLGISQETAKQDVLICRRSLALETPTAKLRPL